VFGTYHKTGCEMILGMCYQMSGVTPVRTSEAVKNFSGDPVRAFNHSAFGNWYFEPNSSIILQLPHYRFVHMIRKTEDMIVSSYHWHYQSPEDEYWLRWPMRGFFCMEPETCQWHYSMFGLLPQILYKPDVFDRLVQPEHRGIIHDFNNSVQRKETLYNFYRSIPKKDGVILEAYREMWTIGFMADNYRRTRNDPYSVQVHMEHIQENFTEAMGCMFSFLQKSHDFDVKWALKKVDRLNVQKYGASAATGGVTKHVNSMSEDEIKALFVTLESVNYLKERNKQLSQPALNDC